MKDQGFGVVENGKSANTALYTLLSHISSSASVMCSFHDIPTRSNFIKKSLELELLNVAECLPRNSQVARGWSVRNAQNYLTASTSSLLDFC